MNRAQNGIEKYSTFFGNWHMDEVKNLFGLGFLNQTERIIGEFDFLRAITNKDIIRFPYSPIELKFILGGIEDQDLKQLAFNECVACIKNESFKNVLLKNHTNLSEFFNDKKVQKANEMINDVKKYHKERRQDIQKVVAYELHLSEMRLEEKKQETISSVLETQLTAAGSRLQDVPGDGNCAFTSVKVARGNEAFTGKNQPVQELSQQQKEQILTLRKDTADLMSENQNDPTTIEFINNLRKLGVWNRGIEGGVGIEVLSFVAQAIRQPILVLTQEQDGNYRYWISGTMENPNDSNLTFHEIEVNEIGQTLNKYPNAIKLFHNGNHFQAIVPNS